MNDNAEKIDLSGVVSQKELFNYLFNQNLVLQAHVHALHATLAVVMAEALHKSDKETSDFILDKINECRESTFKNDPLLVAVRKKAGL